jgi:trehalose/maltose transport system substrate-binding protein
MAHGTEAIAPLPAGPAGRAHTIGGFHIGVSRNSKYPDEAAKLAVHLTGADVQRRRALRRGHLPTRTALYMDPELVNKLPQLRVIKAAGPETWLLRPQVLGTENYAAISSAYYGAVHAVLSRDTTASAAATDLHTSLIRLTRPDAPITTQ